MLLLICVFEIDQMQFMAANLTVDFVSYAQEKAADDAAGGYPGMGSYKVRSVDLESLKNSISVSMAYCFMMNPLIIFRSTCRREEGASRNTSFLGLVRCCFS